MQGCFLLLVFRHKRSLQTQLGRVGEVLKVNTTAINFNPGEYLLKKHLKGSLKSLLVFHYKTPSEEAGSFKAFLTLAASWDQHGSFSNCWRVNAGLLPGKKSPVGENKCTPWLPPPQMVPFPSLEFTLPHELASSQFCFHHYIPLLRNFLGFSFVMQIKPEVLVMDPKLSTLLT